MTEMREKIARAIHGNEAWWDRTVEDEKDSYRRQADRVLALIAPVMEENEALKHDLERQMTIANIECNEAERLREALEDAVALIQERCLNSATGCGLNRSQLKRYNKARAALSPSEKQDG
jgi:hypothetical protein